MSFTYRCREDGFEASGSAEEVLLKFKQHDAEKHSGQPLSTKPGVAGRSKLGRRSQGMEERVDGRVSIRVNLEGDLASCFLFLKKKKGLKNNSELIRHLVAEEFERVSGRS